MVLLLLVLLLVPEGYPIDCDCVDGTGSAGARGYPIDCVVATGPISN